MATDYPQLSTSWHGRGGAFGRGSELPHQGLRYPRTNRLRYLHQCSPRWQEGSWVASGSEAHTQDCQGPGCHREYKESGYTGGYQEPAYRQEYTVAEVVSD